MMVVKFEGAMMRMVCSRKLFPLEDNQMQRNMIDAKTSYIYIYIYT